MSAARTSSVPRTGLVAALLSGISLLAASACADGLPLWLIEDADNRIWLLGSIHLLREQDYPLPEPMRSAYEEAETLVMELDMDELDPARAATAMFTRAATPEGRTLASLMGPEKFARARTTAAEAGIDLDRFRRTEPWYAALTVTQMQLARHGYDPRHGLDAHMAALARRDGKPVDGLETFEEQLAFFDELPVSLQSDMLLEALSELQHLDAGMRETVDAWLSGDSDYLADVLLEELRAYPELYDTLVVGRNRRWAPRLARLLEDESDYLVIVGALHLVGPDSVLELLAAEGLVAVQADRRPDP
jgi:uncharacterized protein YbaP (TraB family)